MATCAQTTAQQKSISHLPKQTQFEPPHQELSFAAGFSSLAPKTSELFPFKPTSFPSSTSGRFRTEAWQSGTIPPLTPPTP
jgi:hypothetical protein